jgi:hypothetical protein
MYGNRKREKWVVTKAWAEDTPVSDTPSTSLPWILNDSYPIPDPGASCAIFFVRYLLLDWSSPLLLFLTFFSFVVHCPQRLLLVNMPFIVGFWITWSKARMANGFGQGAL